MLTSERYKCSGKESDTPAAHSYARSPALAGCEREHGVNLHIGAECTSYPQAVELAEVAGWAVFVPELWWKRCKEWAARTQPLPGLDTYRRTLQLGWNRKVAERRPEVAKLVKALGG